MKAGDRDSQNKEHAVNSPAGIDLGLGSLLSTESEEKQITESLPLEASLEPAPLVEEPEIASLSEFEQLFNQQRYSEIVSLSEKTLEDPQIKDHKNELWLEAQAWWIISQIKLESFPAAVLEAPFESLLETLKSDAALIHSKTVAQSLIKAVSVYIDSLIEQRVYTAALNGINHVVDLADKLDYRAKLKLQIGNLSQNSATLSSSDLRILSELRKKLDMDVVKPASKSFSAIALEPEKAQQTLPDNFGMPVRRRSSAWNTLLLILTLICAVYAVWSSYSQQQPDLIALLKSRVQSPSLKFELPKPALSTEFSELDAMLYEVNKKIETNDQQFIQPEVAETAVAKEVAAAPVEKIKINTTEPKESEELKKLRTQKPTKKDAQDESSIIVPGPAQAPQFKEYPTLKLFEVIRATSLMSQPSPRSEAVAGLSKGDFVQVEAREGYWLRIVSKQGKTAYVLAEDLQPTY